MNDSEKPIGTIEWRDLSVKNADEVSNFYASVVGWQRQSVSMGSALPPQWLMYVRVENSTASSKLAVSLGGRVIQGPTLMGGETYFVIEDPAGAVLAIFS